MTSVKKLGVGNRGLQVVLGRTAAGGSSGTAVLAATILGSSMAFIDGTAVNVALPTLQAEFRATVVEIQWVVESYLLFLSALILVGGALGDRFGRRRIFASGTALFAGASVWAGLAPNVDQLILARAVQGIGGALLVPGSLAMISATFAGEQHGRAIGTWSAFTAVTMALGPVLGGWFVDHASWRWVFFINVPLAMIVLGILYWRVPETLDEVSATGVDWWGALLATFGLGSIVYGLIEAGHLSLGHAVVIRAVAIGFVALIAFIVVEAYSRTPMMPLILFRSRTFSGANVLTLFLYAALGGTLFFLPFNLIQVQGYSAMAAGAALLPLILMISLLSQWAGGLEARYGARLPLTIGPVLAAVGYALLAVPGIGSSYWTTFFPGIAVLGLGMAISVAPLTTAVMNAVESRHAGLASGINNAVARMGGLLAIAVLGLVVLTSFNSSLDSRLASLELSPAAQHVLEQQRMKLAGAEVPAGLSGEARETLKQTIAASFVDSFRLVMLIAAGLAFLSALTALLTIKGREPAVKMLFTAMSEHPVGDTNSEPRAA
ncbi:MFS transporter [Nitrospiraceae bacterium AH_259_D15_M11_P09]|nr:MFS transporter [Nitrospiraceae bacterium AH_259_D15_M11_P09]